MGLQGTEHHIFHSSAGRLSSWFGWVATNARKRLVRQRRSENPHESQEQNLGLNGAGEFHFLGDRRGRDFVVAMKLQEVPNDWGRQALDQL